MNNEEITETTFKCVQQETQKANCNPKPKNQGYKKLVSQKAYYKILRDEDIYLIQW